jgi:ADP-ribose pyrophosphatase YjhB (NUDIX family)
MVTTHVLARGVIRDGGQVLVARAEGQPHTFLPGGHREDGEGLEHCLHRELDEELGVQARITGYLGGVEHRWTRNGARQYEINHCFSVAVPTLTAKATPPAREESLSFAWTPTDRLAAVALEPAPLRTLLAPDSDVGTPWWASTIDETVGTKRGAR